jgi:hypothetical protein
MRTIQYAVDPENGVVYSAVLRHGSREGFAIPVLDFAGMNPENNFEAKYNLEKFENLDTGTWDRLRWTKKIPVAFKNLHREFWGMKPLKAAAA